MSFLETREMHSKEALRTRWFQGTYDEIKKAIFETAEDLGYGVVEVNDTFKEMLLEGPHVVVIKISSYGRYEHGVDLTISTKWLLDLGRGKNVVTRFYNQLGKHAKFKGVSLHP